MSAVTREALIEAAAREQTIWREGDRIRRSDGNGYGDGVSDAEIVGHIVRHVDDGETDPLFVPFAQAVLAIRAFERASALRSAAIRAALAGPDA